MKPEGRLQDDGAKQRFQATVDSAIYLSQVTRYGISYAVNHLARARPKPSKVHMASAKPIRYLAGVVAFSITYTSKEGLGSTQHSGSNGGNTPDNGKSTSVYIMIMCNGSLRSKVGLHGLMAQ